MNVGRPPKYETEELRKEMRRLQYRRSKRNVRIRKKLHEVLNSKLSPEDQEMKYRDEFVKYFSKYDFNYFFTGTFDPDLVERNKNRKLKEEIQNMIQILEMDLSYHFERRIGIDYLKRYTEKYIQFLVNKNRVRRWLVFFETGNNDKYHVHVLFGTDTKIKGFKRFSETHWLLGRSKSKPVNSENNKVELMTYCVKEFKPRSRYVKDIKKMDNWFFDGDFNTRGLHKGIMKQMKPPQKIQKTLSRVPDSRVITK